MVTIRVSILYICNLWEPLHQSVIGYALALNVRIARTLEGSQAQFLKVLRLELPFLLSK